MVGDVKQEAVSRDGVGPYVMMGIDEYGRAQLGDEPVIVFRLPVASLF
jgi:hypothetical protein